jgi:receptor protein-tyrosine kinase
MTRLSQALQRAKAASAADAPPIADAVSPSPAIAEENHDGQAWKFAPVETMYVPDEPPRADAPETVAPPPAASRETRPRGLELGVADRQKLIVDDGIDRGLVEQYRHLAAVMHHAQKASNVRTVMVTSALPAEGKTLTATNLALTLSESYQRRVLLIDADLRRPRMREMFALPGTEGLTDSLSLRRETRLPVHQVTSTLWVLTAGHIVPDPMSLLVSPAMKQLIDEARDSFDWVVVDTPPVGLLPDANLLAKMIDTTLLVVSARSTPYPMVQRAAEAVGTQRILGVVLNRAEHSGVTAYGYYGSKHYQPGHPSPARRRWFGWLRKSGSVPHVQ